MNIFTKPLENTLEGILPTARALTRIQRVKEEKLVEVYFPLCSAHYNCKPRYIITKQFGIQMKKQEFLHLLVTLRMRIIITDKKKQLYTFFYKEHGFTNSPESSTTFSCFLKNCNPQLRMRTFSYFVMFNKNLSRLKRLRAKPPPASQHLVRFTGRKSFNSGNINFSNYHVTSRV